MIRLNVGRQSKSAQNEADTALPQSTDAPGSAMPQSSNALARVLFSIKDRFRSVRQPASAVQKPDVKEPAGKVDLSPLDSSATVRRPNGEERLSANLIRINLLPHRELKRAARQRQLIFLAGSITTLAALIIFLVYGIIDGKIQHQNARNAYLKSETDKLVKQIEEIDKLKEQIQAVLSRKKVVETLQGNRSQSVYLLDQLVRLLPDGVYLKAFKQTGVSVNVQGYAQSNARVATFIRNLESSQWLETPELIETKAATVEKNRLSEFSLNIKLKPVSQPDDEKQKKSSTPPKDAKAAEAKPSEGAKPPAGH